MPTFYETFSTFLNTFVEIYVENKLTEHKQKTEHKHVSQREIQSLFEIYPGRKVCTALSYLFE